MTERSNGELRGLIDRLVADNVAAASVVVHVGAGHCRELETYRRLGAEILLVEPNSDATDVLRRRGSGATVVEAALAPHDGKTTLRVTNDPRFCALIDPRPLAEHYAGLKAVSRREVEAMSFSSLMTRVDIETGAPALLVLEVLGLEDRIVADAPADALKRFSQVVIRAVDGRAAPAGDMVRTRLTGIGFTVAKVVDQGTPFAVYVAVRSDEQVTLDADSARRQTELEQSVAEYEYRQQLMDLELARLRSQIDLIKDLLLGRS